VQGVARSHCISFQDTFSSSKVSTVVLRHFSTIRLSGDEKSWLYHRQAGFGDEQIADSSVLLASKAHITVKETEPGYHYYWQWRADDSWANEYIGPVTSENDS
jgi:hypothetical protein